MENHRPEREEKHAVVLFDGICNLCNGAVTFIIDRDPHAYFKMGALQSKEAAELLLSLGLSTGYLDSLVLIEKNRWYSRSDAVLRITRRLRFPWPLLFVLVVIPRPIRNAVYDFIARYRYRWFGTRDSCRMPTPSIRRHFLSQQV